MAQISKERPKEPSLGNLCCLGQSANTRQLILNFIPDQNINNNNYYYYIALKDLRSQLFLEFFINIVRSCAIRLTGVQPILIHLSSQSFLFRSNWVLCAVHVRPSSQGATRRLTPTQTCRVWCARDVCWDCHCSPRWPQPFVMLTQSQKAHTRWSGRYSATPRTVCAPAYSSSVPSLIASPTLWKRRSKPWITPSASAWTTRRRSCLPWNCRPVRFTQTWGIA